MFNFVKKEVQTHVDFVNDFLTTHQDFSTDISGLSKFTDAQLAEVLALEEQINKIGTPTAIEAPKWTNIPMTPVDSSFVKGVGAYKGKLLLQFHHHPDIWGFDVQGQGEAFFKDIMLAGSKGGWVWDKILGKPSEFGMAKGKFFAYPDENGVMHFYTTPGAQFVHKYGRPSKFSYNPVGYLTDEGDYNAKAQFGKQWKESVVRPSESRQPAEMGLIEGKQRAGKIEGIRTAFERLGAIEEIRPMLEEKVRLKTFEELQEAFRERTEKGDLIRDILEKILQSQLTITPIIHDVISKVKGHVAFNKRSERAKSMDKRIRAKKVFSEVTEEWLNKPNYTDVEGIDTPPGGSSGEAKPAKPIIQGYYSPETIMGRLSDLDAMKTKYKNYPAVVTRIEYLANLFNDLKGADTIEIINDLEKRINQTRERLYAQIDNIKKNMEREAEGARIIGEYLSRVPNLKEYENDERVKELLSALRALESNYSLGAISLGAFKIVAKVSVSKIDKHINKQKIEERSTRKDWDKLDQEAEISLKSFERERIQERKNRVYYAKASIEKHQKRLKELKGYLKKVDPETGMMWEKLPSGKELGAIGTSKDSIEKTIKEIKKSLNEEKTMLETTKNLNEINPPGKFEFHDPLFRLAGRSKYKQENLKWLNKTKEEYLKIPARFRGYNSSVIKFVDKTTNWYGRRKSTAGGTYSPAIKRINIASNPKIRKAFESGSVVAHEMGHNVWYEKLGNNQKDEFRKIWLKYAGTMRKVGDDYASTSDVECFAEAFMEYATGQLWFSRQYHNGDRIKDNLYPTLQEHKREQGIPDVPIDASSKSWGMLDDYPEMKEFFNTHLGPNKNLEVKS